MKKINVCFSVILILLICSLLFSMKIKKYDQTLSAYLKSILEKKIEKRVTNLGEFFLKETEVLQFEFDYLTVTIKNKERIKDIMDRLADKPLYSEVFPIIVIPDFPIKMTLKSKEAEISFIETNETLEVSDPSFLYGYVKDAEDAEKVSHSDSTIGYLYHELFKILSPYQIKISPYHDLMIVSVQNDDFCIESDVDKIVKDSTWGSMYYLTPYDIVENFDYKKEGLKAYENGSEIEELPNTIGLHCIFFERGNEKYLLTYHCD